MAPSEMPAAGRDAAAASRFLTRRYGAEVDMHDDLAQGEWSRAYAFRHAGRDLVVRFNPSRDAFDVDLLAMRFASTDIPIPRVIEVGEVEGGFYAISERAFGEFLEELSPGAMRAAGPSVLAVLDGLRLAGTSASTGFGPWDRRGNGRYSSWAGYLLDVESEVPDTHRAGWRDFLERSGIATCAFRAGMDALEPLATRVPDLRHLVHSDLLNRNAFVSDGRVTALIDWQCAMYGDFLYDLAWLTFWAPWHPGLEAADFRATALRHYAELGLAVPHLDDRMRCYELHIGLRHLVYNAWRGDLRNLEGTARRTLEVVG